MAKKMSNRQYAQALYEVTVDLKGEDLKHAITEFVRILVRDHKLRQGENIIAEFVKYSKKQAGEVEIEVTSARELDKTTLEKIKKIFGDKVEAVTKVDKSLLGGVSVKLEDRILDASLKTQLNKLKLSLNS